MVKRKLKKGTGIALIAIALLICIGLFFGISKMAKKDNTADQGSQAQMLEDNGNLDLVVPEDQETGGF